MVLVGNNSSFGLIYNIDEGRSEEKIKNLRHRIDRILKLLTIPLKREEIII